MLLCRSHGGAARTAGDRAAKKTAARRTAGDLTAAPSSSHARRLEKVIHLIPAAAEPQPSERLLSQSPRELMATPGATPPPTLLPGGSERRRLLLDAAAGLYSHLPPSVVRPLRFPVRRGRRNQTGAPVQYDRGEGELEGRTREEEGRPAGFKAVRLEVEPGWRCSRRRPARQVQPNRITPCWTSTLSLSGGRHGYVLSAVAVVLGIGIAGLCKALHSSLVIPWIRRKLFSESERVYTTLEAYEILAIVAFSMLSCWHLLAAGFAWK